MRATPRTCPSILASRPRSSSLVAEYPRVCVAMPSSDAVACTQVDDDTPSGYRYNGGARGTRQTCRAQRRDVPRPLLALRPADSPDPGVVGNHPGLVRVCGTLLPA